MKIIFIFFMVSVPFYPSVSQNSIELVESVPDETTLDNPDIRNTKEVWLELLAGARSSIDVGCFYVAHREGEALGEVLAALQAAATRGVAIRIVSDSKMYRTYPETLDTLAEQENISVRILDFGTVAGGVMHAKYFIVDSAIVFLGSQNLDWRALTQIHEIGVSMRSRELAGVYQGIFDADWEWAAMSNDSRVSTSIEKVREPVRVILPYRGGGEVAAMPTLSPPTRLPDSVMWDETAILHLIENAKRGISIQVMNYSATDGKSYYEKMETAMRRAAARGVKVRLLVSDWSTGRPKIDHLKGLDAFPNIEVRISTIPQHSSGFISYARVEHCKYMVVDGIQAWIGTSNWSRDYFYRSRNVGIILDGAVLCSRLQKVFDTSWESIYAAAVDYEKDYRPPKREGE